MAVKNPATGELGGPAVDLARELARQRGVGVTLVGVQTPQNVIDAVRTGQADVGFVAYNPERAGAVEFWYFSRAFSRTDCSEGSLELWAKAAWMDSTDTTSNVSLRFMVLPFGRDGGSCPHKGRTRSNVPQSAEKN